MTTKTVSQNHMATVANGTASAYSILALRVGQYARYKHWRRSLLDGRAAAARPLLARKVGLFTKVEFNDIQQILQFSI